MLQGPDPAILAPMVVSIVLFVSGAAVLIFRPLTKRLGDRIAGSQRPVVAPPDDGELTLVRQALEETNARLERLEQRLDFTERLLTRPSTAPGALPQAERPPRLQEGPPAG